MFKMSHFLYYDRLVPLFQITHLKSSLNNECAIIIPTYFIPCSSLLISIWICISNVIINSLARELMFSIYQERNKRLESIHYLYYLPTFFLCSVWKSGHNDISHTKITTFIYTLLSTFTKGAARHVTTAQTQGLKPRS